MTFTDMTHPSNTAVLVLLGSLDPTCIRPHQTHQVSIFFSGVRYVVLSPEKNFMEKIQQVQFD